MLLGKAWLAIDVLLLGCVPLAGCTAFLALRRVTLSVPVRLWAAASYALLPVAFGAISAGRLGSAVAFVFSPVIGMLAGRMFSQPPKIARRAAWATGLAVTVGAAFVPLLWPMAATAAVLAAVALRRPGRAFLLNLAIVVLTPPVLLLPWLNQMLAHPSRLLLEAGLQQPGLAAPDLPAKSLLLLSPGGPGLPPYWVSAALVLAGLAALLASGRLKLVMSGWTVALALGFAAALLGQPGDRHGAERAVGERMAGRAARRGRRWLAARASAAAAADSGLAPGVWQPGAAAFSRQGARARGASPAARRLPAATPGPGGPAPRQVLAAAYRAGERGNQRTDRRKCRASIVPPAVPYDGRRRAGVRGSPVLAASRRGGQGLFPAAARKQPRVQLSGRFAGLVCAGSAEQGGRRAGRARRRSGNKSEPAASPV